MPGVVDWLLAAWLISSSCRPLPPVEPAPDDTTVVVEPEPDPPPAPVDGTPCARSCARRDQLACRPVIPNCVEACDASELQGLAYSWQPAKQATAVTCQEWDRRATEAR